MSDFGRDGVVSDMGSGGSGNAVGKDIQSVQVSVGDISNADLQRALNVVFGDGLYWEGVVREIRKLENSLTEQMTTMEQRLESRIKGIENKIDHRPTADVNRWILLSIMVGMFVLTVVVAWGVWVLANSGGVV